MSRIDTLYPTWNEARAACPVDAFDDADVARAVVAKTTLLRQRLGSMIWPTDPAAATLAAVALAGRQRDGLPVRVLDFGGAAGLHFFSVKAAFADTGLRWCVVETAALVQEAAELGGSELAFRHSIAEAVEWLGAVDLVHASGSLQYVAEPEDALVRLLGCDAAVLMLGRLPLYEGTRCVGVQPMRLADVGPGPMPAGFQDRAVSSLVTFLNRDWLRDAITGRYDVVGQFRSQSADCVVAGRPVPGVTLIARHRSAGEAR
jgi:putative methyltransferase (TIGR04325 family)